MARQLLHQGAMVVGIDMLKLKTVLEADGEQCELPAGDLENLSHFVQAYSHAPSYLSPILVGLSSGGSFAYAMLAQAPRNTFAAALTLDFCPNFGLDKPLCKGSGLESARGTQGHGVDFSPVKALGNPWVDLHSDAGQACPAHAARDFISRVRGAAIVALPDAGRDFSSLPGWAPQFIAAYNKLSTQNPTTQAAPPPASLSGLPRCRNTRSSRRRLERPQGPQPMCSPSSCRAMAAGLALTRTSPAH